MQKFFFDMIDGVPFRDRIGLEFKTNADAIAHCGVLAQHFFDESLADDQDLEILVVNASGRDIASSFIGDRPCSTSARIDSRITKARRVVSRQALF